MGNLSGLFLIIALDLYNKLNFLLCSDLAWS
jgi:hypothetical protein